MRFRQAGHQAEFEVEISDIDHRSALVRIDGQEIAVAINPGAAATIVHLGHRTIRVFAARQGDSILIAVGPRQFEFFPVESRAARRTHGLATPEVTAPMPGKVVKLLVTQGQQVEAGEALVVLEAMKMETALHAESAAIVKRICAEVGQMVDHGVVLLELSPAPPAISSESGPPGH